MQTGGNLGQGIFNVQVTEPTAGEVLAWSASDAHWVNATGGSVSSIVTTTDFTGSGATGDPLGLSDTGVIAGTYTYLGAIIDSKGRIRTAINGAQPLLTVTTDATLTGLGTSGSPLHVVPASVTPTTVNSDGVTIDGDGALGTPITLKAVQKDATLVGAGTVASPLGLSNTAVTPATYTFMTGTVNQQGRLTSASTGVPVTSVATGTGLTGGPITSTGTLSLANTAVTPGSYTYMSGTVDQQGRLTSASSGAAPTGTVSTDGVTLQGDGSSGNRIRILSVQTDTDMTGAGTVASPLTLSVSGATPGSYTYMTGTVDSKGRLTSAASGAAPLTSVTHGATLTGAGTGGSPLDVANTAVTPGTYTYMTGTVDQQGRLTSASSGAAPLTSVTHDAFLTGAGTSGSPLGFADSGATPGTYTFMTGTVDVKGRLTSASTGVPVTSVASGTGLTGGPITSTGTLSLANTAVTPGTYTFMTGTVDQQGRLTSASTGVPVVSTDGVTLQGDGSTGNKIRILAVQRNSTLAGSGIVSDPMGLVDINTVSTTKYSKPITLDKYGRGSYQAAATGAALDVAWTQSITSLASSSSFTAVLANNLVSDSGVLPRTTPTVNGFVTSTGVATINYDGAYVITVSATFQNNGTGSRGVNIQCNGAGIGSSLHAATSGSVSRVSATWTGELDATTTISGQVFQDSGSTLTCTARVGITFLHDGS